MGSVTRKLAPRLHQAQGRWHTNVSSRSFPAGFFFRGFWELSSPEHLARTALGVRMPAGRPTPHWGGELFEVGVQVFNISDMPYKQHLSFRWDILGVPEGRGTFLGSLRQRNPTIWGTIFGAPS